MVLQFPAQPFYRAATLTVDTSHAQQKYAEDEDKSVLDDGILDHGAVDSGLELSPPMVNSRRESFAVGSAIFSPKSEGWHSVDMQSLPSNNPFVDQANNHNNNNNPFTRLDHSQQQQVFGPQHQQTGAWLVGHGHDSGSGPGSGAATPFPAFDHVEYDSGISIFHRQMQTQTPFGGNNIFGPLDQSIPTSPQKDWSVNNKKMRPGSPPIRSHNDMRRGDGIRKKNARFEIPAERNLNNIDQLISQSTDDQEIKELKQQKRLLRNRQAALDSRQRKKQHTERLEDEKKQFTLLVTEMEEEINSLKAKMDQLLCEKQTYSNYVESLRAEKDEMIRAHTIETGQLRKRLGVITDHVQRLQSGSMAPAMSGHSFADDYDGMDDVAMTGGWDNAGLFDSYPPVEPPVKQAQHVAVVPVKKMEPDGDKSTVSQGGLLFMLFLVGAFVLSNRSTPAIPQVSEDVRAASATLLDNVFKDAGVSSQPHPSGVGWAQPAPSGMGSVGPSMLDELGDSLTQPTEEQTNDQIFSLTSAEYSGVSDQDYGRPHPPPTTRPGDDLGRRNLADALASMRAASKQSGAAEVYTRSLLWDQIPSEVVRNFAKMVAECNSAQDERACNDTT
ncbi:hypothetical protein CP533_0353 [Ophiocordyceps camponoti-saundersi (nom. inval.)]|nr:hypothetical protein CP533_0353 [Ophiocordyceps camponoti-saundersi (nom. inval.)]